MIIHPQMAEDILGDYNPRYIRYSYRLLFCNKSDKKYWRKKIRRTRRYARIETHQKSLTRTLPMNRPPGCKYLYYCALCNSYGSKPCPCTSEGIQGRMDFTEKPTLAYNDFVTLGDIQDETIVGHDGLIDEYLASLDTQICYKMVASVNAIIAEGLQVTPLPTISVQEK